MVEGSLSLPLTSENATSFSSLLEEVRVIMEFALFTICSTVQRR